MDIDIFTLLNDQVNETAFFLQDTRNFAEYKGLEKNVQWINGQLAENKEVRVIIDEQLGYLEETSDYKRMGLFETIGLY